MCDAIADTFATIVFLLQTTDYLAAVCAELLRVAAGGNAATEARLAGSLLAQSGPGRVG